MSETSNTSEEIKRLLKEISLRSELVENVEIHQKERELNKLQQLSLQLLEKVTEQKVSFSMPKAIEKADENEEDLSSQINGDEFDDSGDENLVMETDEMVGEETEEIIIEDETVDEEELSETAYATPEIPEPSEPITQESVSASIEASVESLIAQHSAAASESKDNSIAAKFRKTAISDLTNSMGLNQKMLFTKGLFQNNSTEFNEALTKLNNFSSSSEAISYINESLQTKYNWDTETEIYQDFVQIVERRYA